MENFDYEYENNEIICSLQSPIELNLKEPILYNIINDIKLITNKKCEYDLIIYNLNEKEIQIEFLKNRELKGKINLIFNHKYPLEPPIIQFKKPKYDFITNLNLSFDFKLFNQDVWSINENLDTIIEYIINIIKDKDIKLENFEWTEEELIIIEWLNEINYFKNKSYFEEYKENNKGKGIGYSTNKDDIKGGQLLEKSKNKIIEIWKNYKKISEKDFIKELICKLNLESYINNYIEKSSFLFIQELKDYLIEFKYIQNKINLNNMIKYIKNSENCIEIEDIKYHSLYEKYKNDELNNFQQLFKRIIIDLCDLEMYIKENQSIYYAWNSEYPQYLKILIKSNNEPYIGGYFEFDFYIPVDYPTNPPKCQLMTTGYGKIRFNPNLYADGKVCLSLLGTWSGEPWNQSFNNLTHIIQAISVMILTDQPVQNEPAYTYETYYDENVFNFNHLNPDILLTKRYKFQIKYNVIQNALIYYLKNNDNIFKEIIKKDFIKNKNEIIMSCEKYLKIINDRDILNKLDKANSFQCNDNVNFNNYESDLKIMIEFLINFF
jgi:ubiquitin-protein ligase